MPEVAELKKMRAARAVAFWKATEKATDYAAGRAIAKRARRDVERLAGALGVDAEEVEPVELDAEEEAAPSAEALFKADGELVPAGAVEADDVEAHGTGATRCRALTAGGRRCREATDGTAFCTRFHDDLNAELEVEPAT